MNICKGLNKKGLQCKNKCLNKYCYIHKKIKIGGNNIEKKVSFEKDIKIINIKKNDCPKHKRPRLRKIDLTDFEKAFDNLVGIERKRKFIKKCPTYPNQIYKTKNGFECCKIGKKKIKKKGLNPNAKEFKM